ncbi:MAG TPA: exodeoxyribonuclease V subunit gamma [Acidimicrobiales bacterium]|nr:exodeoxyribonuclease V subunit gamma [Acidimicrobiales bacterium]
MLDLRVADDVRPLAAALAQVLVDPLDDAMAAEWVAVPTEGMTRWLRLELARVLGASDAGAGDGVCANVTFALPGALRDAVLAAAARGGPAPGTPDPWHVDRLVWAVLEALHHGGDDEHLGPIRTLPAGATWYGRARRVADLFDRYAVRRPDLVRNWHAGRDVDATGRAIAPGDAWQPHLWRLVRALVASPSPPERLPDLLDEARAGTLTLDLPPRVAVFGITTLPGGPGFLELLDALSHERDVHCYLLDPSQAATERVLALARSSPSRELARADDRSANVVRHPLLASWGRPYRERAVLVAAAGVAPVAPARRDGPPGRPAEPRTLLERVQRDIREDLAPDGTYDVDPADRSIQLHACHGVTRQVEVARDALLHLLADDPTLAEEDIVVLCPAIAELAPIVEAVFGTSATELADAPALPDRDAPRRRPAIAYRIADRSLRDSYPALAALDAVLELVAGRFSASAVSELLALGPVRERFGFDDADLATVDGWIAASNIRWGLDGAHRERWGVPGELTAGTWRAGLDRVLMGVAVGDDELALAAGDVAPIGVDSGDIEIAGRFADALAHLRAVADDLALARTPQAWSATLAAVADRLLATPPEQQWQLDKVREVVDAFGGGALVGSRGAAVELTLADVRRALADRLSGPPRRPDFFRGGVTVSSLTPLRWLPFRVVCIVGLDDSGTAPSALDGDDLAAAAPRLGDRDARAESRQALLEALLAAGDHLIVTRTGHDERSNRPVPPSVAYAELRDTVAATRSHRSSGPDPTGLEIAHPRQSFDERCLVPGELGSARPWSFDPGALDAALARRERRAGAAPFLDGPLPAASPEAPVVTVTELAEFLRNPVRTFVRARLGVGLPGSDAPLRDEITTSLAGLDRWSAAQRLVAARLAGRDARSWSRHERCLGTLPPGGLGELAVEAIASDVDELFTAVRALSCDPAADGARPVDVEVELSDGTRVVGAIACGGSAGRPGPVRVTYSTARPLQHLEAALDLAALVAHDPATPWRSVTVRRSADRRSVDALVLHARGDTPDERRRASTHALEVVVDCYRRALREPIPLWPSLSRRLYDSSAKPLDWRGRDVPADGDDEHTALAFGAITLDEVRALPARPDDPPGTAPGRADRYARYLWLAIEDAARVASAEPTGDAARPTQTRRPSGGRSRS